MIQQWDFPVDEPASLVEWRRQRLTGGLRDAARRVAAGETLRAVAAEYGLSHETLRRRLQHAGLPTQRAAVAVAPPRRERQHHLPGRGRSMALAPDEVGTLLRRYKAGESIRSLARAVGVSHETVRRVVANRDLPTGVVASA